jgi:PhnB protein
MKALSLYLHFNGDCEQALEFYKKCLNGEILSMHHQENEGNELNKKVMHAEFRAGDEIYFMASDSMPNQKLISGDQVSLSLNFNDENEQTEIFNKLSEGGVVVMPLQDTFWDAKFGMLKDKFGIRWMLNCHKNQAK